MNEAVFIKGTDAHAFDLFGAQIVITMPASRSGGAVSVFEDVRGPGSGPPLHVHHGEDEIFRIVEGRFRLLVGAREFEAGPGDMLFMPRDVPHCFCNVGDQMGRLVAILQPGGFEQFFVDLANEQLDPARDMPRINELAARYRLEFLGPNPFMSPAAA